MNHFQEYNTTGFSKYSEHRTKEFDLLDVQKTTLIKTRNPAPTALLITFEEEDPNKYLDICGEQAKIKVYEYYE